MTGKPSSSARDGDHDTFAELVAARLPATFRAALAILGNESDARDVTQTIFLQAWRKLPTLREPDLFVAWVRPHRRQRGAIIHARPPATQHPGDLVHRAPGCGRIAAGDDERRGS